MNPKVNQRRKHHGAYRLWMVRICISGLLLFLVPLCAGASELVLGAGKAGTFSNFTARLVCRILSSRLPETSCSIQAVNDEIDSLTNLQNGSIDLALVDSQTLYNAATGSGDFRFVGIRYDNLAVLMPLYDRPIGIVVRRDAKIATLDDLRDKRINGGALGSEQRQVMEMIMTAKGWTEGDFEVFQELPSSHSQDTMVFCHGTVQAMVTIGVHPDSSVERLLHNCRAALLPIGDPAIDKLVAARPFLWRTEIRAASYPAHSRQVSTFGTRMILAAPADMDERSAGEIVRALQESKKRLAGGHPALGLLSPEEASGGMEKPALHQGAARYFGK